MAEILSRMAFHRGCALVFLTLPCLLAAPDPKSPCDKAPTISFADAQKRAVTAPPPVIPPLAKAANIGGSVQVAVCVSETGEVVSTKLISGHPLLVTAAMENSKAWRFEPLKAPFRTILEIEFVRQGTPTEQAREDTANQAYFAADEQCRTDLKQSNVEASVRDCSTALERVAALPVGRVNERRLANELVGHAYFRNRDFQNALTYYSEELKIARATLHDYEAELAYAYHDVALVNHMLGNSAEAAQAYTKAEQILPVAAQRIHMDGLDKKYLATLKRIQQEHLALLKQVGDTAGAATLQKQIDSDPN